MLGQKNYNKTRGLLRRLPLAGVSRYLASRPPFSRSRLSGRTACLSSASRLPLACTALLVLLVFLMFCPTTTTPIYATTTTTTAYLPSTVSLTMGQKLSSSVEPTALGKFTSISTAIGVEVTSADNFTVSMKGDTHMSGTNNNSHAINPVSPNTPASNFANNTWGYSWNKGNTAGTVYNPVPAEYVTLDERTITEDSATETYTLGFGIKVDTTLPADTYTGSVVVSVVANPKTVIETTYEAFAGITTMQGMTSAACKNAKYGETARLEDIRDGKKYWVTKLADGNCWMTQNLDFDITTEGLSTDNGSNVDWYAGSNWEGTNNGNYPPVATNKTSLTNNTTATNTNSWDQGMYVYSTPTESTSCGTGVVGISACTGGSVGKTFVKVDPGDGWLASDDPDYTKNNGSPINSTDQVYDAHYLIGNYYTYNAATAGTGAAVSTEGANAAGDICPAGSGGTTWELPSAGEKNNSSNSFYHMLVAQGMAELPSNNSYLSLNKTTTVKTVSYDQYGAPIENSTTMTVNEALTTAPLFFVRSGVVGNLYNPSILREAGARAECRSRSYSTTSKVFVFWVYNSDLYHSAGDFSNLGTPVRCLYHPTE